MGPIMEAADVLEQQIFRCEDTSVSLSLCASQQISQQHCLCSFYLEVPLLPPTPLYLTKSSSLFKAQFMGHQVSEPFPDYSLQLVSCPPLCFHSILYLCQKPPDICIMNIAYESFNLTRQLCAGYS